MQDGKLATQPFLLATAKGFTGHSEAAAGAAGLSEAVLLLTQARAAPALHLRQLNPHVAGVIGASGRDGRSVAVSRAGADPVPTRVHRAPDAIVNSLMMSLLRCHCKCEQNIRSCLLYCLSASQHGCPTLYCCSECCIAALKPTSMKVL